MHSRDAAEVGARERGRPHELCGGGEDRSARCRVTAGTEQRSRLACRSSVGALREGWQASLPALQ